MAAQVIVRFKHDSQTFDPNDDPPVNDYLDRDADTGVITMHLMLGSWTWSNFDPLTMLGRFDPPPHIIATPFNEGEAMKIRVLPMPEGAPVSFGHSEDLLQAVQDWYEYPATNYGLVMIADELPDFGLGGDQHVYFKRQAWLRLTLDRNP